MYFSCSYLKSLLCDRKFTVFTDHRNLLFISQSSNPMIVRWLTALSEFSYRVEFITGVLLTPCLDSVVIIWLIP
jgi:RNase H-like domain found in reverse transcriptase